MFSRSSVVNKADTEVKHKFRVCVTCWYFFYFDLQADGLCSIRSNQSNQCEADVNQSKN